MHSAPFRVILNRDFDVQTANSFKAAINAGQLQIGFWQSMGTVITAEISAYAGFDWLLVDGEHGVNDLRSIRDQLQVISPSPSHAIVRIATSDAVAIKQVMDAGAQTILVPMVETAAEAEEMVKAMRYPPDGMRGNGAGVVRVSNYGRDIDYVANANEAACLLVQVESMTAIANLDEILAVDGVDGVFIGPADLATSMGYIKEPSHPYVENAIHDAIRRIKAAGKAPGILMGARVRVDKYIELGATFVAVGSDVGLFTKGVDALAASYKGGVARDRSGGVY